MAHVTVLPVGVKIEVSADETVMQAAIRFGYTWPTVCHGEGTCGVCFMEIVEGGDSIQPVERREREVLEGLAVRRLYAGPLRLACQARLSGDVTVRKRGVRPNGTVASD